MIILIAGVANFFGSSRQALRVRQEKLKKIHKKVERILEQHRRELKQIVLNGFESYMGDVSKSMVQVLNAISF